MATTLARRTEWSAPAASPCGPDHSPNARKGRRRMTDDGRWAPAGELISAPASGAAAEPAELAEPADDDARRRRRRIRAIALGAALAVLLPVEQHDADDGERGQHDDGADD